MILSRERIALMIRWILITSSLLIISGAKSFGSSSCRINIAVQSLMSINDPLKAVSWWAKREATLQFDTLVRFNESGEIQPWLARRWQFSKDLKTLIIELRSGVKFTDGTIMDSQAVVDSLKRYFGVESMDHGRLSYVKNVRAIEKSKIEIILKNSFAPLLYYLATPRAGIVKKSSGSEFVGSGPWIYERTETKNNKKNQIWKANEKYFNGTSFCSELGLVEVPMNELQSSFKDKIIDLIEYYPSQNINQNELNKSFGENAESQSFPSYDVTALFFTEKTKQSIEKLSRINLLKIIFNEFKVPQHSVGYSKVCSILPFGMSSNDIGICSIEQNKIRSDKRIKFFIHTQDDERSIILNKIADIAKKKNYFIDFSYLSLSELYSEHAKGNVAVHVETLTMQIPDPYGVLSMFETGSGENFTRYSNSAFDNLLRKAKAEGDLKKRKEYYDQAEHILLEDAIVIPLVHQSRVSIYSKNIIGYNSNSIGPFYATYDKIIKKEK